MTLWQTVLDTILHVTWLDVLDVGVIAYIIYRIALAVRGTRVISLLKGVALVLLLLGASTGLPTFNWILQRFLPAGVVALVVIFQPELRVTLERLGRGAFLHFASQEGSQDLEHTLSEVMDACEGFAASRVGALIVFERDARLVDVTRTGRTLDALVSSELLATIFAPRSPLHDGAVVVRDDRIIAAGCALPHSENPSLSATIGMRHRAALGLSERTDAVVVVVSEETGVISLAVEGALRPSLERIALTERLLQLFEARRQTARFFFWRR